MLRYGEHQAALKKFFVVSDHRGAAGPSRALFDQLMAFARAQKIQEIVLGTPASASRSHAFYERAGFEVIERSELPEGYKFPDRGSIIYRLKL